jgi:multiple sugar transport system substrate-binding protein
MNIRAISKITIGIIIVVIIIIAAITALLIPPSPPTTTTTPTQTTTTTTPAVKVKLTVIGPWAGDEEKYFRQVINEYMKLRPDVEITYVIQRAEDIASTLPAYLKAGKTPADVIFSAWGWFIVDMAKSGYLVDLTPYINQTDYVNGIFNPVKYDNKIWGAPFTMWLKPGFWYRKSFFQKYNLTEPKTWDDFLNLLNKIKGIPGIKKPIVTGDSVGWPIGDIVEHFLITFGGPDLQYKLISGSVKFNDTIVKSIFENRLIPLLKNGDFSEPIEWTTAKDLWWNNEYALYFMGTWITGMVNDPNDLSFFTLPGDKGVVGGTDYIFVPKYSENVNEAIKFVQFLATKGQVIHASTPAGKIPTWTKASADAIWSPMKTVYNKIVGAGMAILPDLDDSIGGDWQKLSWDQFKLLWVNPDKLNDVLNILTAQHPAIKGA